MLADGNFHNCSRDAKCEFKNTNSGAWATKDLMVINMIKTIKMHIKIHTRKFKMIK